MQHPTLIFRQDPALDAQIAWNFFENPVHGGEDLWQTRALAFHEPLTDLNQHPDPRRVLETYVRELYQSHAHALAARSQEIETSITRSLPMFFQQTDRLFPGHQWPQQTYTAFFSVFNFCPRFLKEGSFQLFLQDTEQDALFTACHELLHFIFYDFAQKKFPDLQTLNKNSGPFWILTELFNDMIQRTPAFTAIHGEPGESTYSVLQSYGQRAKELWDGDASAWIASMFPIVNSTRKTTQDPTGA